MTIALYVESISETIGDNGKAGLDQTIIVPNYTIGAIQLFHRTSTGKRGRSEAWTLTPLSDLPNTRVIKNPVAIRLTDNDHFAIQGGKVTTLGYKTTTASDQLTKLGGDYTLNHFDLVTDLVSRFENADSSLSIYLTDSRYKDISIEFPPLVPNRAFGNSPVSNSVTPTISHNAVSNQPVISRQTTTPRLEMELASVPDIKWAKSYINRKVVGDVTDFDIFDVAMRNDENVLITGHAGSGKTSSVMAYASARGYRYYNFSCSAGTDTKKLFGGYNPSENGHFHWQDGAITDLVRNGGVLLIGEITFMPERTASELYSLLDYRREIQLTDKDGEVVKAHPDLLIVADGNLGYRGTRELSQAFNDRFTHHLDFPYDPDIEGKLIKSKAILEMANSLRDRFEEEEIQTPISTRSLVALMGNINSLGIDYGIYAYLNLFPMREQASVKLVIDTYRYNIEEELGLVHTAPAEPVMEVLDNVTTN